MRHRLPRPVDHLVVGQRPRHDLPRRWSASWRARGHDVLFLERDVPWYADNRDLPQPAVRPRPRSTAALDELRDALRAATVRDGRSRDRRLLRARTASRSATGCTRDGARRHRLLRHRHAGHAREARRAATASTSTPELIAALRPVPLVHRRPDAARGSSASSARRAARAALLLGRSGALLPGAARRALGPRLPRHLQRRPPADARARCCSSRRARWPRRPLRRRRAAVSRRTSPGRRTSSASSTCRPPSTARSTTRSASR